MKKLTSPRILIFVSFFALFALSCKKELKSENPLDEAKSYYLNLTSNAKTSLKSDNGSAKNVTTDFLWNKSKIFKFSDNMEVVGTPIKLKINNDKETAGSFMLLIYKTNNLFNSMIIYNAKNDYFNNTISNTDVEAAFKTSKKNSEIKSLVKNTDLLSNISKDKTMLVNSNPVCIDWYWTTYSYDDWGNIIEILSEVYLYTTCNPDGNGDGGGIDPQEEIEPTIEWGEPDDTDISQVNAQNSDTTGVITVGWYCYKAHSGAIHFKSYERVYYDIVDVKALHVLFRKYKINHLDHISMAPEGNISGQDISPIYAYFIDQSDVGIAKIKLTFKDRREYVQNKVTKIRYSPDITASKSWSKAQLGLNDNY